MRGHRASSSHKQNYLKCGHERVICILIRASNQMVAIETWRGTGLTANRMKRNLWSLRCFIKENVRDIYYSFDRYLNGPPLQGNTIIAHLMGQITTKSTLRPEANAYQQSKSNTRERKHQPILLQNEIRSWLVFRRERLQ